MESTKWGLPSKNDLLGENAYIKLAVGQFTVIVLILMIARPDFCLYKQHHLKVKELSMLKIFAVALMVTAGTYYIPFTLRNV